MPPTDEQDETPVIENHCEICGEYESECTCNDEPLGLGPLSKDDVDEIRRRRQTGPTYDFFRPIDEEG